MYYRYKSKKKDRRLLKIFVFVTVTVSGVYAGYMHRSMLMFWRINHNHMVSSIENASRIEDTAKRIEQLKLIGEDLNTYKHENMMNPEAYLLSSKLNFQLSL